MTRPESDLGPLTGKQVSGCRRWSFKIVAGKLCVRALADNKRPRPETALHHAPFWNVYPV
jgi:hypothetical protein